MKRRRWDLEEPANKPETNPNYDCRSGDLEGAATVLKEAVTISPGLMEANYGYGGILKLQGRLEDSLRYLMAAKRISPLHEQAP